MDDFSKEIEADFPNKSESEKRAILFRKISTLEQLNRDLSEENVQLSCQIEYLLAKEENLDTAKKEGTMLGDAEAHDRNRDLSRIISRLCREKRIWIEKAKKLEDYSRKEKTLINLEESLREREKNQKEKDKEVEIREKILSKREGDTETLEHIKRLEKGISEGIKREGQFLEANHVLVEELRNLREEIERTQEIVKKIPVSQSRKENTTLLAENRRNPEQIREILGEVRHLKQVTDEFRSVFIPDIFSIVDNILHHSHQEKRRTKALSAALENTEREMESRDLAMGKLHSKLSADLQAIKEDLRKMKEKEEHKAEFTRKRKKPADGPFPSPFGDFEAPEKWNLGWKGIE